MGRWVGRLRFGCSIAPTGVFSVRPARSCPLIISTSASRIQIIAHQKELWSSPIPSCSCAGGTDQIPRRLRRSSLEYRSVGSTETLSAHEVCVGVATMLRGVVGRTVGLRGDERFERRRWQGSISTPAPSHFAALHQTALDHARECRMSSIRP